MAKFNRRVFTKDINKSLGSKEMKTRAYKIVQDKVAEADRKMVQNFDSHVVTREINSGPDSSNISGTLGGYGNLFSFIGFPKGSSPTDIVRAYMRKGTRVYRTARVTTNPNFVEMAFRIKAPSLQDIEGITPSPWDGKSWIRGVERGISGLGYYINEESKGSRSGKGYQSSKEIRGYIYKPIKYITSIIEKFNEDLQR